MEYLKLKEVADIYLGLTHTPKYVENGIPFLSVKNISGGNIDFSNCHYITEDEYNSLPKGAKPKCGDMLFCRVGTIGKPIIIKDWIPKFGSFVSLGFLRKKNNNILLEYLKYWMNSNLFYKQVKQNVKGVAQINLNSTWLKEFDIPKITIVEQKKIVDKLSKIEQLIKMKNIEIEKLNQLIKSQFVEMFGDPIINDKNWKKKKLFDECEIITGNTPSRKIELYYGNYIEWIKSDNIYEEKTYLTIAKEYLSEDGLKVGRYVDKNCILMTCIAGSLKSIGNVGITNRKVSFNQQINGIIPNENNVYFLYELFVLSKDYLHTPVNMSLKGILSKNQLGNLEFIFPPIDLQNKFGKIFEQIDKQKFEFEKSLKKLEELQSSLMQEYFG